MRQIFENKLTDQEIAEAKDSFRILSEYADSDKEMRIQVGDPAEEFVLSASAQVFMMQALEQMSLGNNVEIVATKTEFTTQEAANFLNVSHSYFLEKILSEGKLDYSIVQNQTRIRYTDIAEYCENIRNKQAEALNELVRFNQELEN